MRKMEALRLRVKDVDFDRSLIVVREGKGNKDRITMLPSALVADLQKQLAYARSLWESDRALKRPGVETPPGVAKKYPRAAESWSWFWVFRRVSRCHPVDVPGSGVSPQVRGEARRV
jgi:integrase